MVVLFQVENVKCFEGNSGTVISNVSGGLLPYTYSWSNGSVTPNLSDLVAGTYTLLITDLNGCNLNAQTIVNQPTAIQISTNVTQVSCNGATDGAISLVVTGGTAPYQHLWNTGSSEQSVSGLPAGSYSVTITDTNNCTLQSIQQINQPSPLTVSLSHGLVPCFGGTTLVSALVIFNQCPQQMHL